MIETKTKPETLKAVQFFLSNIPYINAGGCGIAALAMARWIKKNSLRMNVVFVFGINRPDTYQKHIHAILDTNNKPGAASHVCLLIYDYATQVQSIIDSDGPFNITLFSHFHVTKDEYFVLRSVNARDQWNSVFDREMYVSYIATTLDIDLSDIDIRNNAEYLKANAQIETDASETESLFHTELKQSSVSNNTRADSFGIWEIAHI